MKNKLRFFLVLDGLIGTVAAVTGIDRIFRSGEVIGGIIDLLIATYLLLKASQTYSDLKAIPPT